MTIEPNPPIVTKYKNRIIKYVNKALKHFYLESLEHQIVKIGKYLSKICSVSRKRRHAMIDSIV